MAYHSLREHNDGHIRREFSSGVKEFGKRFIVGLGTIAAGINGDEPILSYGQFKRDLRLAKELGVKEAVIFRLGGLNNEHSSFLGMKKKQGKVVRELAL